MIRKLIPMLFSTEMARANMDGRKTETRRIVKLFNHELFPSIKSLILQDGKWWACLADGAMIGEVVGLKCPYGKPGDILWMRETWAPMVIDDFDGYGNDKYTYAYKADPNTRDLVAAQEDPTWKSNMHMPLEACRFFAEITEIKVEQLQDITAESAIAEGVEFDSSEPGKLYYKFYPCNDLRDDTYLDNPKTSYYSLWTHINGSGSWQKNPLVWVVKYRQLSEKEFTAIIPDIILGRKKGDDALKIYSRLIRPETAKVWGLKVEIDLQIYCGLREEFSFKKREAIHG